MDLRLSIFNDPENKIKIKIKKKRERETWIKIRYFGGSSFDLEEVYEWDDVDVPHK